MTHVIHFYDNAIKNGSSTLQGLSRFVSSHAGMLILVAVAILLFAPDRHDVSMAMHYGR